MSNEITPTLSDDDPFSRPSIQIYLLAGVAGLLASWVMLLQRIGLLSVIPLLCGAIGIVPYAIPPRIARLSSVLRRPNYFAPVIMLLSIVAFFYYFTTSSRGDPRTFDTGDLLLAGSMVACLAAQYRLFSLGSAAFPPDQRPSPISAAGDASENRPESTAGGADLVWFLGALVASIILAFLVWRLTVADWPLLGFNPGDYNPQATAWRVTILIFVVGIGTLVLTGLFRLIRTYRLNRDEARMALQDSLWTETRGEQRRVSRWIAWQDRRLQRKKENEA